MNELPPTDGRKLLRFGCFSKTRNLISLARLCTYHGPLRNQCDKRFGEQFKKYVGVRLEATTSAGAKAGQRQGRWAIEVEYGTMRFVSSHKIRVIIGDNVKYDFVSQLIDGLNECLGWYEANIGDAGSVPECQNPEHGEISRLVSDPECVPDGDAWTCLGCGWRVNAEGLKLTQKLFPDENQMPARKVGQHPEP